MPVPKKRDTRARKTLSRTELRAELANASQLAQDASRVMAAREAWRPIAARRSKLMRAHAVTVGLHRRDGLEVNYFPDGQEIAIDPKLRAALRDLPLNPPPETCVRGAAKDDTIEVIRALLALEKGLGHAPACRLAAAAAALPDREAAIDILTWTGSQPHRATSAALKRLDRSGAYRRWKADLRQRLKLKLSYAGESVTDYERRMAHLRELADVHGIAA